MWMCGSAETPPERRLSQLGGRVWRAAMERRPYQTDEQVSGLGSHVRVPTPTPPAAVTCAVRHISQYVK